MSFPSIRSWTPFLLLAGVAIGLVGCDGIADLDVENRNAPSRDEAIQDPSDIESILEGGYQSFWFGVYQNPFDNDAGEDVYAPSAHLDHYGDANTTTNAFANLLDASSEPRKRFNNQVFYGGRHIAETPWLNLNSAASSANDVLRTIEQDGTDIVIDGDDVTTRTRAAAYFLRGLAHGYLANIFDQAYTHTLDFSPRDTTLANAFSPYGEVVDQAVSDLQTAKRLADENGLTLPAYLPWGESDTGRYTRLANSFSARFLVLNSRSSDENTADQIGSSSYGWGDVETFTENGIQDDLFAQMNAAPFINGYTYLSVVVSWYHRVDHRIINLMDPTYPAKYPADAAATNTAIPPAESEDQRLCTISTSGDLNATVPFLSYQPEGCYYVHNVFLDSGFNAGRGAQLFSVYFWAPPYIRDLAAFPFQQGMTPVMLRDENELMEAEAEIRSDGNVSAAVSILEDPANSRKANGGLGDLESTQRNDVLKAIFYERTLELPRTSAGLALADLRRRDALQAGTPKHIPVPATELQSIGADVYTFGGVNFTDEEGTATGDQAWCSGNNDMVGNTVPSGGCSGPYSVPSAPSSSVEKVSPVRKAPASRATPSEVVEQ